MILLRVKEPTPASIDGRLRSGLFASRACTSRIAAALRAKVLLSGSLVAGLERVVGTEY
jgi:hypothetical protein